MKRCGRFRLAIWVFFIGLGLVFQLVVSSAGRLNAQVAGVDLSDALLLYDSGRPQISDFGFRTVVDFYGLTCADVDLATITLTDALLRDEAGTYYPTVYIAGATLEPALDANELQVLKTAIGEGGVNLLVSALQIEDSIAIQTLTDGGILGSTDPIDSRKDYYVAEAWPEVTRELSGITVVHESEQLDYALTIAPNVTRTQVLVSSTDDDGRTYPLFVRYTNGLGEVFVSSDNPDIFLRYNPLYDSYYPVSQSNGAFEAQRFAHMPLMIFVRFTAGDEAWHRDQNYANLTIDDPPLQTLYLDYGAILPETMAHNYHLTIAMPPVFYEQSEPEVIELFLNYPDRLSLVQHGNNHDGYEFYKYTTEEGDPYPPRPIEEQEADIVEGRTRMEAHFRQTGIPYAPVMIFPHNISPAPTLSLLKQYNFQATINSIDVPLGETRSRTPNAHMYPAELSYNNFAVILRHQPHEVPSPFELFIDKPAFIYSHQGLFINNAEGFNTYADAINGLYGEVEWRSLDYIMKRLYLEKTNDDGSIDVMFFGNHLSITNESAMQQVYHVKREETLDVPIVSVTVDGMSVDYTHIEDVLQVDLVIPAGASRELQIRYAPANRDFALSPADVVFDVATGIITATVHNRASEAGPVTVGFFEGPPENGGKLLALVTAPRIEPGATAVVTATLEAVTLANMTVAVDPYEVIVETVETNNMVTFASFRQYLPLVWSVHKCNRSIRCASKGYQSNGRTSAVLGWRQVRKCPVTGGTLTLIMTSD